MAACLLWSSSKVVIARLTAIPRLIAIPSYATMESAARRSWNSGEVAISLPSRSNCGHNLITINGMPSEEDDDKASD
ncbi:hypothetical protein TIFTF001_002768 [Ficus carica]|uniref:Uncharacterized protein n=1 Tax=Ficus carica TaxID=3494 RepID=A0AA87ZCH4_FICCA|nr:hypothetical protein TIFTF001_002768 [Ficus carica]